MQLTTLAELILPFIKMGLTLLEAIFKALNHIAEKAYV